jgi:hypothetical protein
MKNRSMRPGWCGPLRTQRGAAYLLTISAILGALTIMVMSFSSITVQRRLLNNDALIRASLVEALDDIERQLREPDSKISNLLINLPPSAVLSSDQIKTALTSPRLETIRYAISPSMQNCAPQSMAAFARCVSWRRFAAWIPSARTPSVAPPWPLTNGLPEGQMQTAEIVESRSNQQYMNEFLIAKENALADIANSLRSWYFFRREADPNKAATKNFWLPAFGCTYPRPSDLACRADYDFASAILSSYSQDGAELMRALGLTSKEVFIGSPYILTYKNEIAGAGIGAPMELRLHSSRNDIFIHILIPPP